MTFSMVEKSNPQALTTAQKIEKLPRIILTFIVYQRAIDNINMLIAVKKPNQIRDN